jgi:hypothetical protein
MKPVIPRKLVKSAIALAVVKACLSQPIYAEEVPKDVDSGKIEKKLLRPTAFHKIYKKYHLLFPHWGLMILSVQALLISKVCNKSYLA